MFEGLVGELNAETITAISTIVFTAIAGLFSLAWRHAQAQRLKVDAQFHRENHNLNLFEVLSKDNNSLQLSAASLLVERLKSHTAREKNLEQERRSIIRALISITKRFDDSEVAGKRPSPELIKFVAEHVMDALGALDPAAAAKKTTASPLQGYDFQNVNFSGAYLKNLSASGIDFFRATFENCGVRMSNFRGAVLYEASLAKSTFNGSDFSGADLRSADLRGALLLDCVFDEARLDGAIADARSKLPMSREDAISRGVVFHD